MNAATRPLKASRSTKSPSSFESGRARTSFQSSELSRSSSEVFAAAADHPVQVTRRDGESLVLMSASADAARSSLLELAAQLVAVSTSTEGTLAARMGDRFPWMLALNPADQEACANEILAAARASFATHEPHLAIAELTSWRETATAIAAGLGRESVEWLDHSDAVVRP
ncbi:prevent-host-death protein [Paenarthrobacter sp. NPDC056912]|uniref:prevent-host-death protein n=1 Tax=Paenarthrobacter sp. NPDC056912 TaxID=3345965 RepID=UPI00366B35B1